MSSMQGITTLDRKGRGLFSAEGGGAGRGGAEDWEARSFQSVGGMLTIELNGPTALGTMRNSVEAVLGGDCGFDVVWANNLKRGVQVKLTLSDGRRKDWHSNGRWRSRRKRWES